MSFALRELLPATPACLTLLGAHCRNQLVLGPSSDVSRAAPVHLLMQIKQIFLIVVVATCTIHYDAMANRPYRVADGDDCASIAEREFGSRRFVAALHEANPQLGAEPHTLRKGDVLRIPEVANSVGTLVDVVGDVTIKTRLDDKPRPAAIGIEVPALAEISVGKQASAVFRYTSGGPSLQLRPGSIVNVNNIDAGVYIISGSVTTKTRGKFVLSSKWARIVGDHAVTFSNDGTAISNHGDSVVTVEPLLQSFRKELPTVALQPGFGIYVGTVVGGALPHAQKLPSPPRWSHDDLTVLSDNFGAAVQPTWWRNAEQFGSYRLLLQNTETGLQTHIATPHDQAWTQFTLAPGHYRGFLTTVSPLNLESKLSDTLEINVKAVDAPWLPRDNSSTGASLQPRLPIGARITMPSPTCEVFIESSTQPPHDIYDSSEVAPGSGGGRSWQVSRFGPAVLRCGKDSLKFTVPPLTLSPRSIEWKPESCIEITIDGPMIGEARVIGSPGVDVIAQNFGDAIMTLSGQSPSDCARYRPANDKTVRHGIIANVRIPDNKPQILEVFLDSKILLGSLTITPKSPMREFLPLRDSLLLFNGCEMTGTGCPRQWFEPKPPSRAGYEVALGVALGGSGFSHSVASAIGISRRLRWRLSLEADAQLQRARATLPSVNGDVATFHVAAAVNVWNPSPKLAIRLFSGLGLATSLNGDDQTWQSKNGIAALWRFANVAGIRVDASAQYDGTLHAVVGLALFAAVGD
jgi:phage tail protein X